MYAFLKDNRLRKCLAMCYYVQTVQIRYHGMIIIPSLRRMRAVAIYESQSDKTPRVVVCITKTRVIIICDTDLMRGAVLNLKRLLNYTRAFRQ